MITSNEVAQIMASQGQMFAGQDAYAQQIGVAPPPGGGMFQQYGSMLPTAGGNFPQPNMYAPQQSFGPSQQQYQMAPPPLPDYLRPQAPFQPSPAGIFGPGPSFGNRVAGTALSGMSGVATAVGTGLAVGSMFLGGPASLAATAGLAFAGKGLSSWGEGARGQIQLGNSLQQNFQHFNPQARGGQGFTRDESMSIGNSMRQLEHLPELMTNMEEMTQKILPKLKQMGVMQGARDAGEFAKRFKDAITTIGDISRILGTSLEDAQKMFEHSRSMGFLTRAGQMKNMMDMKFSAAQSGSTVEEIGAMQQQGAATARSYGARGRLGAEAITRNSDTISAALQQGTIGEEFIRDYTGGLSGAEGTRAAAGRISGTLAQAALSKSAMGNAMMLGMMRIDENGRPVLREDMADKFKHGEITKSYLQEQFSKMTSGEKMAFSAHPEDLAAQFSKLGLKGIYKFAQGLANSDDPNKVNLVLRKQLQMDDRGIELLNAASITRDSDAMDKRAFNRAQFREAQIREKTDISGGLEKIFHRKGGEWLGGLKQSAAESINAVGAYADDKMRVALGASQIVPGESFKEMMRGDIGAGSEADIALKRAAASFGDLQVKSLSPLDQGPGSTWHGLTTGNSTLTSSGKIRSTLKTLGISGDDEGAVSKGQAEIDELVAKGQKPEYKKARDEVERIKTSLGDKYSRADGATKQEMLRDAVENDSSLKYDRLKKSLGGSVDGGLASFAGGDAGKIALAFQDEGSVDLVKSRMAALAELTIEQIDEQSSKITRDLSYHSSEAVNLSKDGKGRMLMSAIKANKEGSAVSKVLRGGGSAEDKAKTLSKLLKTKVATGDIEELGKTLRSVAEQEKITGGGVSAIETNLGKLEDMNMLAGASASKMEISDMVKGMTEVGETSGAFGLKGALSSTAAGEDKDYFENMGLVKAESEKLGEKLFSADRKGAKELVKGMGDVGERFLNARDTLKGLEGKKLDKSAKDRLGKYGLSEEDVTVDSEGKIGNIAKAIGKAGYIAMASDARDPRMARGDEGGKGDLNSTLVEVNKTLQSLNTTMHDFKNPKGIFEKIME